MKVKIKKWGNSLGLRIPKSYSSHLGLVDGSQVELNFDGERLIIIPSKKKKSILDELLSQVSEKNIHQEIKAGSQTGKEVW